MPRKPLVFNLSSSDRQELEDIINQKDSDKKIVLRCKIILLTEEGIPLQEIADRLGLSKVTVNTCRQNYLLKGINGIKFKKRPGRPSKLAKEIMSSHFPGSEDNIFLPLRKALNMKSKSDHLLNFVNMVGGVITYSMIFSPV